MMQTILNKCYPLPAIVLNGLWGILLFLLTFTTTALGASADPHYGGKLELALEYKVYGFDAIKSPGLPPTGWVVGSLVMERLFEAGENGELIPVLGLSATPSPDNTIWTIKLRQGVKFHDGTPFTADAVVNHWQRILNPENRYRRLLVLKPIKSIEKVDAYTVQFHLRHPWKPFLSTLTGHRGLAQMIPSPLAVKKDTQNRAPVGTGPFIFKEWRSADRLVVKKNPDYWQKGKPYLDEITVRIIPDHETRYAALVSGQVDMIYTDRARHIQKLSADSNFSKITAGGAGAIILLLNTRRPPLDDVRVRQALAYAWNQGAYLNVSLKNTMPFAKHWYGNTLDCGDVNYCEPDLEKARALIKEYGNPVQLEYLHSATSRGRETAEIVQQLFKKIGVTVTPTANDFAGILQRLFSKDYNMASWVIAGLEEMGPTTKSALHSKSPFNLSGYANETVDTLLERQSASINDGIRKEALCEVVRIVNDEVPFLYLFGRKYHLFANKRVRNVPPPRNEYIRLSNTWMDP
jgi:4-phytase/acid phosphatase/peptide/nickel transport system substrate-binding protein